jgi:hypothetical protein
MNVDVINGNGVTDIQAVQTGRPALAETPVTYGMLRRVLESSGIIDLREAQKMDRAIQRLLDS